MNDRDGFKIFLDATEKKRLDELRDRVGMSQKEAATRLVRWFLAQDDVIQKTILRLLPQGMESDIARLILEKMTAGGQEPPTRLVVEEDETGELPPHETTPRPRPKGPKPRDGGQRRAG